jgi:hypothetical protein
MVHDFDFRVGRGHLKGHGWRGLCAFGLWLVVRGTVVVIAVLVAKPSIAAVVAVWR